MASKMEKQMETLTKEMRNMGSDIKEVKEALVGIRLLAEQMEQMKKNQEEMKKEINQLKESNCKLAAKQQDSDQYTRTENMIITGIPEPENGKEDLMATVIKLCETMGAQLSKAEISTVHRMATKKDTPVKPIIIRFVNRWKKSELMALARKEQPTTSLLGFEPSEDIFFSDQLSQETKQLLGKTKELCDQGKVKYAWCRDGKIFIRQTENSDAERIYSVNDLVKYQNLQPIPGFSRELRSKTRKTKKKFNVDQNQTKLDSFGVNQNKGAK